MATRRPYDAEGKLGQNRRRHVLGAQATEVSSIWWLAKALVELEGNAGPTRCLSSSTMSTDWRGKTAAKAPDEGGRPAVTKLETGL